MFEFLVLLGYDFGAKIQTCILYYVSEKEQGTTGCLTLKCAIVDGSEG